MFLPFPRTYSPTARVLSSQNFDPQSSAANAGKVATLLRPLRQAWEWLVPPTQAHKDRQSLTAKITAITLLIVGCISMIVLGLRFARPAKNIIQDWRAERLYQEALQETHDKNYMQGWDKVQRAVKMSPENVNAVRLTAEYLTMMKRPEALHFLDQLERQKATTRADRIMRVRALIALGRPQEASGLLSELFVEQAADDSLMYLSQQVWGGTKKNDMVLQAMKTYAEKHPENREHALRLARAQITSGNSVDGSEGIRRAWQVAEGKDETSLSALELINGINDLPPDEARRLIPALLMHPLKKGWHEVMALRQQVRLDPLKRPQLVAEAVQKAQELKGADLVPYVRWLLEPPQNEYLRVISLISEDQALQHQPLLENLLTAMTFLGRFDAMERLISDRRAGKILNHAVLAFYRAHLAFVSQKSSEETRAALITAKAAADTEQRADLLKLLAKYAEERKHFDIAEEAFTSLSRNRALEREGYDGLIRATKANGNTERYLAATAEATRRWPEDNRYQDEHLYACLLTGQSLELATLQANQLNQAQPNDMQRRFFLAMAAWRLRDMPGVIRALSAVDPLSDQLSQGQRAIIAAMARSTQASNAEETTRQLLSQIDPKSSMMPEERACYNQAAR